MSSFKVCFSDYVYCLQQKNIYFKKLDFRDNICVEIFFQQKINFSCDFYVIVHIIDLMNKYILK